MYYLFTQFTEVDPCFLLVIVRAMRTQDLSCDIPYASISFQRSIFNIMHYISEDLTKLMAEITSVHL